MADNIKFSVAMVGGGSGGHVSPLLVVAESLLLEKPETKILIITDKNFKNQTESIFSKIQKDYPGQISIFVISKGKFRRYSNKSTLRKIFDVSTNWHNFKDLFLIAKGYYQSKKIIKNYSPKVVFSKGGAVSVPFCLAAKNKIPIIIHDSDVRPGISNKIVGRFATKKFSGLEQSDNTVTAIGIPVSKDFSPASKIDKINTKKDLDLHNELPTILVTGGGLGAMKINSIVLSQLKEIIKFANLILVTGKNNYNSSKDILNKQRLTKEEQKRVLLFEFTNEMYKLFKVSDLVISRAGSTSIQEIANSELPSIIIPAAQLSDQPKNADLLNSKKAALVLSESDLDSDQGLLLDSIKSIVGNNILKKEIISNLSYFSNTNSASIIAKEILSVIK
jgi:UDP-N-acetylglucosamine--N-acetylmuramyl-(pentapeptide) pyrophosphoryl-undecaprenol N-acetylglucosamine transferase